MKYKVKEKSCRCHPETCSCNGYQIVTDDKEENFVCSGNNFKAMEELVNLAEIGAVTIMVGKRIAEQ